MSYSLTGEFTVKDARNRGNIPNPHGGELTRWYVDFEDESGQLVKDSKGKVADAYWQRKPDAEVQAGDVVYGTITEGDYGLRFKMEQRPDGAPRPASRGGGSERSSGGGSKGNWQPEQDRDPERSARILRQHSQSAALQFAALAGVKGPADFETLWLDDFLKPIVDWFDADVIKAGQAARQGPGSGAEGEQSPAVPVESEPAPASPPANTEQRDLEMAIDGASAENLSAEARAQIAAYMLSELPEDERSRAFSQLTNSQDPAAQGQTIRAMKARTEKWTGAPLAVADVDPDDELPFRRPEYREMFSERERWRF